MFWTASHFLDIRNGRQFKYQRALFLYQKDTPKGAFDSCNCCVLNRVVNWDWRAIFEVEGEGLRTYVNRINERTLEPLWKACRTPTLSEFEVRTTYCLQLCLFGGNDLNQLLVSLSSNEAWMRSSGF